MSADQTTRQPMTALEFNDVWQKLLGMRRGELVVIGPPKCLAPQHTRTLEAARFVLVSCADNQGVGGFYVIAREGEDALAIAKAQELIRGIGGKNAAVHHAH